ncbi:10349_t:CDS:10 [Diversispora eburnea]|uniref:10349_t:CDS:1 n=1 Tax=Diversispora eburnea TaxID=1213867 RepID=A0A9N9FEH1_9GLOM|nr:10349_t:CDS:10 [Diversispora eburnea]
MTSNKRKSRIINDSDDDDSKNETFVVYGTEIPLPSETGEDQNKFQPVWKQEVRDEQGLRRFHGAFKGGWSAGWVPSSFVSSRNNRSERKNYDPKDFMDEEDLEEFGQKQQLVVTEEFDSLGSTERELERKLALAGSMEAGGSILGSLPDTLIDDLILPSKEPIGMRLLKAMGWREGQSIGDRVMKRKKLGEGQEKEKRPPTSRGRLCHDGSFPLKGFVLAERPLLLYKWYSPPELPSEFIPFHQFDISDKSKNIDSTTPLVTRKQTTLAVIADQVPLNSSSRSVFDYVSRRDKERLENLIGVKADSDGDVPIEQTSKVEIPKVEKEAALAALKGYIPFDDDKKKQARYKFFLEVQAEIKAAELMRQPEGLTTEEYFKELNEFAQAARIFRPIPLMMASRFTSSKSSSDEFKQSESGLRVGPVITNSNIQFNQKDTNIQESVNRTFIEQTESTAESAARMNMFGPLTRTKSDFYPNRLLCKRFNIANPHPEHKEKSSPGKTQLLHRLGETTGPEKGSGSKDEDLVDTEPFNKIIEDLRSTITPQQFEPITNKEKSPIPLSTNTTNSTNTENSITPFPPIFKKEHDRQKRKSEKSDKKKKHSKDKKKSTKRSHKDDSDDGERHKKSKRKKGLEELYDKKDKRHPNKEIKLSIKNNKNIKEITTNRHKNRPRAMDLW